MAIFGFDAIRYSEIACSNLIEFSFILEGTVLAMDCSGTFFSYLWFTGTRRKCSEIPCVSIPNPGQRFFSAEAKHFVQMVLVEGSSQPSVSDRLGHGAAKLARKIRQAHDEPSGRESRLQQAQHQRKNVWQNYPSFKHDFDGWNNSRRIRSKWPKKLQKIFTTWIISNRKNFYQKSR